MLGGLLLAVCWFALIDRPKELPHELPHCGGWIDGLRQIESSDQSSCLAGQKGVVHREERLLGDRRFAAGRAGRGSRNRTAAARWAGIVDRLTRKAFVADCLFPGETNQPHGLSSA